MNTRPRSNWEDLVGSFDTGYVPSSPAKYEGNNTPAPTIDAGSSNNALLLALCMTALQQQGFTISGSTLSTRYSSSGSSQSIEQTNTRFSVGPNGSVVEHTHQSFTIQSGPSNPYDFISRRSEPPAKK